MIITIDGPASSGKSSVARLLAEKLGYYYYCSGLLYRACGYVLKYYAGCSKHRLETVSPEIVSLYCNVHRLVYKYTIIEGARIFFDQEDITIHLKTPEIDQCASMVSANNAVRIEIMTIQRYIADNNPMMVADGRDMGSVAFPQAEYKFFLTASVYERARRWHADQEKRGIVVTYDDALKALSERDQRDTVRAHAPLVVPADAITIDSTDMTLQQTVHAMLNYIQ